MGSDITTPYKKLGAWLARADDTVYQAATDGFVIAYSIGVNEVADLKTDGSNPPATIRAETHSHANGLCFIFCPVKKNDYWKVTTFDNMTVLWIPLEP